MYSLKITTPYPRWWLNIILECRRHGQYSLYNSQKFEEIMNTHNIVGRGGVEGRLVAHVCQAPNGEIYFKSEQDRTWFILKWA
jgi:hypothetical protein